MTQEELEKKELSLTLTVKEVNIILSALDELPHKVVSPLIIKLSEQGQEQVRGIEEGNKEDGKKSTEE